jgi:hypothetical protein
MSIRRGPSGEELLTGRYTPNVGVIVAGAVEDNIVDEDPRFIGGAARPLVATPVGAPLANLGIAACWVSNPATGAITVRFRAFAGGVAGGAQAIAIAEQV